MTHPIAVPTLLRISRTDQGRIPESAGWRVLVGSLWTGILVLSALGLRDPMRYSPGLLLQLIRKTLWRVVFALPLVRRREAHLIPWGIAISFIASVAPISMAMGVPMVDSMGLLGRTLRRKWLVKDSPKPSRLSAWKGALRIPAKAAAALRVT